MNKLKINIVTDSKMSRTLGFEPGKIPTKIEYVTGEYNYDGLTIFIDKCFDPDQIDILDKIKGKIRCVWMHDPRPINNLQEIRYKNVEKSLDKVDYIFTYDEYLLDKYPEKCVFAADNGTWIQNDNIKIYPKTKLISMIYSWKNWTEGHKLRHEIAEQNIEGLDLYGDGSNHPIQFKEEGIAPYKFSITIENSRAKYYYTEKLLDCLACGTVPIYWGCKNLDNFFDTKGIIQFEEPKELINIFYKIMEPDYYESLMPYIKNNFDKVLEYSIYDDWMYENVYKKILPKYELDKLDKDYRDLTLQEKFPGIKR